jgi:hypothetical protein
MLKGMPRYSKRGRPGRDAQPDQVIYHVDGALASSLAARQGLIDQHSCFILATNELDDTQLSPQEGHAFQHDPLCARSLAVETCLPF